MKFTCKKKFVILYTIFPLLLLISCKTTSSIEKTDFNDISPTEQIIKESQNLNSSNLKPLTILFGGDIMAHKPNFNMKNYNTIWENIENVLSDTDLACANLEFSINDNIPCSSYPKFNVHSNYPDAAIKAGFNVFSLINNHSTDQKLAGIKNTLLWSEEREKISLKTKRPVYACGLKKNPKDNFSYCDINIKGWHIFFCAITQLLNEHTNLSYLNYVRPTEKAQTEFYDFIKKQKSENNYDLCIISVHTSAKEYLQTISDHEKTFYHNLLNNGVDVVWANHPHIVKKWEIIRNKNNHRITNLIMYANGNTISGQRWQPDFKNPDNPRDNTGDGLLLKAVFIKDDQTKKVYIRNIKPIYITTYINSSWEFIIKQLNNTFISKLKKDGNKKWAKYLSQRKQIMEKIKGFTTWQ